MCNIEYLSNIPRQFSSTKNRPTFSFGLSLGRIWELYIPIGEYILHPLFINMIFLISKYLVIFFGIFFIGAGLLMLIYPQTARKIISKAGSTPFINYFEITLRMVPATAMILISDHSKMPLLLKLAGWFMLATSLILFFVPIRAHHTFSQKGAKILKPLYMRLIGPFAAAIGAGLIYLVL
jgi:uncharacterized protein YjeT (DUF2065 family)